jgi:hypothetical protein
MTEITLNADGTRTVKLTSPIKVVDEQVDTLTLAKPRARHLEAMDSVTGSVVSVEALIGALSGVPVLALREMDAEDFSAISAVIKSFLEPKGAAGASA